MKVRIVAAPISVAMIHSSSRSRIVLRTEPSPLSPDLCCVWPTAPDRPANAKNLSARYLRLRRREARGFVDALDEVLAEAALHLGVDRHQLGNPGLLLGVAEDVDLGLARRPDLFDGIGIVPRRGVVEERACFLHRAIELRTDVVRQRIPELLVGDERVSKPAVV